MKKYLFLAALLGFAVACGGQKTEDKKTEEAAPVVEAVEEVEAVVAEPSVEVAVEKKEEADKPALTLSDKEKLVVEAVAAPAKEENKFTVSEAPKKLEKPLSFDNAKKDEPKSGLKLSGNTVQAVK